MALNKYPIYLHNSLNKKKETFKPINRKKARVYSCGLTVYDYGHIGNFRAFLFADILVRTLKYNGYKTKYVQNITDVGHLTDDADEGEDKVEKRAGENREKADAIVEKYTNIFLEDSLKLNLLEPDERPKASGFIKEQIDFIRTLEDKGYTYKISDGIYFDTSKLTDYGKLIDLDKDNLEEGARIGKNPEKINPTDFALWKFSPKGKKRYMEWKSPWGIGFPGWHIECSAIGKELLGFPFDIHTGGIDHKPVHHTNEIAQNEALLGKPSVNYWLHNEHALVEGKKMSKSEGNFFTISDLGKKNYSPLAYRYLVLNTHYRQMLNFSWDAMDGAESSYTNLRNHIRRLVQKEEKRNIPLFIVNSIKNKNIRHWKSEFIKAINDDLNTPQALSILWDLVKKPDIPIYLKLKTIADFDRVLGLGLEDLFKESEIPKELVKIVEKREKFRKDRNWSGADHLRQKALDLGYIIEDTPDGPVVVKK